jgi:hypothetical protein
VSEEIKERVALFSKLCKKCGHLDADEPKRYSKCHYSKGNEFCPAGEIQLVIVGKAHKYAQQVIAARNARDVGAEARILQLVEKGSKDFIERFYFYLEHRGGDK